MQTPKRYFKLIITLLCFICIHILISIKSDIKGVNATKLIAIVIFAFIMIRNMSQYARSYHNEWVKWGRNVIFGDTANNHIDDDKMKPNNRRNHNDSPKRGK